MLENDKFVLPEQDALMQCTGSETVEILELSNLKILSATLSYIT